MLAKIWPWLAGGIMAGIIISANLWLLGTYYTHAYLAGARPQMDNQTLAALVETGINDPQVQDLLQRQIVLYLRSPEGRQQMATALKSPEMIRSMSDNMQSPELKAAILNLMQVPEFRRAVLDIVKEDPDLQVLASFSAAIAPYTGRTDAPSPAHATAP